MGALDPCCIQLLKNRWRDRRSADDVSTPQPPARRHGNRHVMAVDDNETRALSRLAIAAAVAGKAVNTPQ